VARLSCLTSGSFRPKLGICILFCIIVAFVVLVVVPYFVSYYPSTSSKPEVTLLRRISPQRMVQLLDEAVKANDKTTSNLLKVLKTTGDNLVVSAFSLGAVMSMVAAGAKQRSQEQILKFLHHRDLADAAEGYRQIFTNLTKVESGVGASNNSYTLKVANGLYTEQSFGILPLYSKYLTTYYNVLPKAMDFAGEPDASRETINQLVEDQSTIKGLLPVGSVDSLTKLVLVNSLYFKGHWLHAFDAKGTRQRDFQVDSKTTVKVQMMRLSAKLAMAKMEGATALRLPYKSQSAPEMDMVVILPDKGVDLDVVEQLLASSLGPAMDSLEAAGSSEDDETVNVQMPKFRIETSLELNDPLKQLGVQDVFDPRAADLSGMSLNSDDGDELFLSLVVQKAFVEVDEAGSEAAAASAGVVGFRSLRIENEFVCNRPFHFVIRQRASGLVLFSGRVIKP